MEDEDNMRYDYDGNDDIYDAIMRNNNKTKMMIMMMVLLATMILFNKNRTITAR